jgi:hypothetical protein
LLRLFFSGSLAAGRFPTSPDLFCFPPAKSSSGQPLGSSPWKTILQLASEQANFLEPEWVMF